MDKIIGIIGGVGPYAGFDLSKKILDNTIVNSDYDHIPQISLSFPSEVPDRTAFLTKKASLNPAPSLLQLINKAYTIGARVFGVACNQVHNKLIFDNILNGLTQPDIELANMIESTAIYIKTNYPDIKKVSVLGRTGTYQTKIYDDYLKHYDISIYNHGSDLQDILDDAIANPIYGIKKYSTPPIMKTLDTVINVLDRVIDNGAELIVLGCTELPLVISEKFYKGIPVIDTTEILAREIISKAAPNKLKQL
ncbi:MAG: aspartate/glutamate racemase family protein [Bacteroidales bacterium]|nr:aspartate/glutamate racemase family protein [Bacteroidales bacterium]